LLQNPGARLKPAGWTFSLIVAFLTVRMAGAQEPGRFPQPSDFSQRTITPAAEELTGAWNAWTRTGRDLEQRVFRVPMSEARDLIQRTLGRYLNFLDKRSDYGDAVLVYVEQCRLRPNPRQPLVTMEEVYEEQARLIGANVIALHEKLRALKDSPEWTSVYAGSRAETDRALRLQSSRRSEIPPDFSLSPAKPPSLVSSLLYRSSEREIREQLRKLWSGYYQALVDAVEQRSGGSAPLIAILPGGRPDRTATTATASGTLPGGPASPPVVVPEALKVFTGAWSYSAGSKQFNGVAEPVYAVLELWYEDDRIVGRYRAELPDFQGTKKVDLRLRGTGAVSGRQLTMRFESKDPPATGQLHLEGVGPSGTDLMLTRAVPPQSPIPRGREVMMRR
jgi:hypothetical protein